MVLRPRTRTPAAMPEVSLSDDARFVLRAEQVLRQAGWQGELFLGVKLVDPTWTRARWEQAQAALAQWQQRQGRARWQRRIRKLCMAPVTLLSVCSRRSDGFLPPFSRIPLKIQRLAHFSIPTFATWKSCDPVER